MRLLSILILALGVSGRALAQAASITGVVLAEAGERPLPNAEVAITSLGKSARTDSAGNFRLDGVTPGTHTVAIRLIGYAPLSAAMSFRAGETLERDFLLVARAAKLAAVEVTKAPVPTGKLAEFEERRRAGIGHFVTQDVFDANDNRRTSEVLVAKVPGIKMVYVGSETAVVSTRGEVSLHSMPTGDETDRARGAKPACYVNVWVDGVVRYAGTDNKLFDLNSIPPKELAAVEYYGSSETPPRYNMNNAACGTLVIWTRT